MLGFRQRMTREKARKLAMDEFEVLTRYPSGSILEATRYKSVEEIAGALAGAIDRRTDEILSFHRFLAED